ncbi:uncharacterized protein LOC112515553 [Cynara cardunculus var. scolymus]|uniref:uncharacterized protein LOC112515553 n=1 Tax=Cynara cardunculus var. scolymus TaxID=59895 RepID=UPI000D626946|nr:uncharacterized protein LOC112515553 [Cynara cardunculus var. scolymus]
METIDGNTITTETLGGVFSSFSPTDDSHKILKPSSEEKVGEDLRPENEVLCDETTAGGGGGDGGAAVVVTTTVIEKTQTSVVIQEVKDDDVLENQAEGFEIHENEKEGVSGNLVGGDDENMVFADAKSSFSGGNGGEMKSVSGVSDPTGVDKQENEAEIVESREDTSKDDEGIHVNGQDSVRELAENEGDYDGERDEPVEEEEDHDFVVGDFIWGKIKSHPWWPGQIYDPSDASDYAATLKRKGHLLVAYFGDGSFSWCSPSQLKPFIDCFDEMSKQSDSKKFVNAVQKALEAVGTLVEAEMMCKCRPVDQDGDGFVAVNSGIKAGVGMPKGNTIKILIDGMNPVELFSTLKASATMEPGVKMAELELTVLKSCLTAFYRWKCGQSLPEYHDLKYIEGLEDGERSGFVSDSDINGPSESGDGKLHQKRKQKSVAELLGEGGEDERKIKKVKTSGGGSGSRSLKRERKRKALVVSVSPESDFDSGGIEEETMSPRQRKKSKYLSPPYTSPIWTGKHSGSFRELKTESEKVPEMAAKHLEDSLKRSSSSSGRKSRSHHHRGGPRDGCERDSKDDQKTIIDSAVNVNKVLEGLLRAALDPSSFVKKKKLPEVSEFVSAFRSSVFEDGSNEKEPMSDLEFIERKLESIREMVKGCEEGEMSEAMKGNLEEGIEEVLEKVWKMK